MQIATNIKKIRGFHKLTQEAFAEKFEVTLSNQKDYERGKAKPGILYLEKLVAFSGFSEKELLEKHLAEPEIKKRWKIVEGREENEEPDYQQLYIQSLQDQLRTADQDKKLLQDQLRAADEDKKYYQRIIETNLRTIQDLQETALKSQTRHDDEIMRALDRLEKNPEGTLGATSDNEEIRARISEIDLKKDIDPKKGK